MLQRKHDLDHEVSTGAYILVTDDDPSIHRLYRFVLQRAGHSVALAENGKEAFGKIMEERRTAHPFDLLITDLEMPNWNGVQLLDRLGDEGVDIPAIVTTGIGDKYDLVMHLLRRQYRDYLNKPVKPADLVQAVEDVLHAVASERQEVEIAARRSAHALTQADSELADYRQSYEQLRAQTDAAVDSYQNLVNPDPRGYNLPVAWRNRPLAELGGDFLDIRDTDTGIDVLIADVAGHDHGASYHTVLIKAFFVENSQAGKDGLSLMQTLNKQLLGSGRNERMATALFLKLDLQSMMGELVCAGHPPTIILRKKIPIPVALHADGSVLGVGHDVRFDVYRFELTPGDRLFLYTDGILDARSFSRQAKCWEKLGLAGLKNILRRSHDETLQDMLAATWESVFDYCGRKPQDDMMLAGFEIPTSKSI